MTSLDSPAVGVGVDDRVRLVELLRPGARAIMRFWPAFLLIQSASAALVVSYFASDSVRAACDTLGVWKNWAGLAGVAVASAAAGGILPEIARVVAQGERHFSRQRIRDIAFNSAWFLVNGVMVELLYRGQTWAFGDHPGLNLSSLKKIAVDMLIWGPLVSQPLAILVYRWRALRYNAAAALAEVGPRWWVRRVLPLLLPCTAYWLPMVTLVYVLPLNLQFPLFAFGLGAWALILTFIAGDHHRREQGR